MAKAKLSTDSRKINSKPIFDVLMEITKKHDIFVFESDDHPAIASYFGFRGRDIIWLNSTLPTELKTEVLAHEIGHFKLHNFQDCRDSDRYNFSTSATSPEEIEADRFGEKLVGLISRNLLNVQEVCHA